MKFLMKALLCGITAASLVACGGDDDAPAAAAPIGGTASGSAAITGIGDQGFNVAQFGIGAAAGGAIIPFAPLAPPTQVMEQPQTVSPIDISSRCTGGGTASQVQTGELSYQIVYADCKINDSGAKFKGTITVALAAGTNPNTATAYDVDFDPTAGLIMSGTNGSATFTFTYKNRAGAAHGMAITDVVRVSNEIKKLKSKMNVVVTTGASSSITLQDYLLDWDGSAMPEKVALTGKYLVSLKPSDFVTLPAGTPDTPINMTFDVSTNPILTVGEADGFSGGTLIMNEATVGYKISTDFTAKKITITVAGQTYTIAF